MLQLYARDYHQGVMILDKESVDVKRKIKEVIHIRSQRPTLNRDGAMILPPFLTTCCHVIKQFAFT